MIKWIVAILFGVLCMNYLVLVLCDLKWEPSNNNWEEGSVDGESCKLFPIRRLKDIIFKQRKF